MVSRRQWIDEACSVDLDQRFLEALQLGQKIREALVTDGVVWAEREAFAIVSFRACIVALVLLQPGAHDVRLAEGLIEP
jgi:hypothetical protein